MLLAIDIGNTQSVLGIFDADQTPSYTGRIATNPAQTPDELRVLIHALFTLSDLDVTRIDHLIIASVVPALTDHWVELGNALGIERVTLVSASTCGGLDIAIDVPSEAGADRLANAVAAQRRYGTPAIVVDFGTATNIDIINEKGAYCGGVISPGLETSAEALFSHAARLSAVDLVVPECVVGTSTRSAVQSGLMFGEAAKVDGLVEHVAHEFDLGAAPLVIATGGLAEILAPLCSCVQHIDPELTLYGLYCIAQEMVTK